MPVGARMEVLATGASRVGSRAPPRVDATQVHRAPPVAMRAARVPGEQAWAALKGVAALGGPGLVTAEVLGAMVRRRRQVRLVNRDGPSARPGPVARGLSAEAERSGAQRGGRRTVATGAKRARATVSARLETRGLGQKTVAMLAHGVTTVGPVRVAAGLGDLLPLGAGAHQAASGEAAGETEHRGVAERGAVTVRRTAEPGSRSHGHVTSDVVRRAKGTHGRGGLPVGTDPRPRVVGNAESGGRRAMARVVAMRRTGQGVPARVEMARVVARRRRASVARARGATVGAVRQGPAIGVLVLSGQAAAQEASRAGGVSATVMTAPPEARDRVDLATSTGAREIRVPGGSRSRRFPRT